MDIGIAGVEFDVANRWAATGASLSLSLIAPSSVSGKQRAVTCACSR